MAAEMGDWGRNVYGSRAHVGFSIVGLRKCGVQVVGLRVWGLGPEIKSAGCLCTLNRAIHPLNVRESRVCNVDTTHKNPETKREGNILQVWILCSPMSIPCYKRP